ncbi:MAG: ThuA domain-containing protein [Verrucomicrobiota bacterium]
MTPSLRLVLSLTLIGRGFLAAADVPAPGTAPAASQVAAPIEMLPASGQMFESKKDGRLRVLLVGGGSSHDFEKYFHLADKEFLNGLGKVDAIYTSNAEEAAGRLAEADVLVLSANHKSFGLSGFQNALRSFADAGKGVVLVHAGVWYNWPAATGYNARFVGGGARGHGRGLFSVAQMGVMHPVLKGVDAKFEITDELYYPKFEEGAKVVVLAETSEDPKTQQKWPSVWVVEDPKTRIVCVALGHAAEAHGNPAYQKLLSNAIFWSSRLE